MIFNKYINKINNNNRLLFKAFKEKIDEDSLQRLSELSLNTYFVAITPRSGSSYFVDLLKKTNLLGEPAEYFNPNLIPDISKELKCNNLVDYWISLTQRNNNDIFGIKISFFQFAPFIDTGLDELFFNNNKIILLKRKNIVKQAISLYLATQSNIFHTNVEHSKDKWNYLNNIKYDNENIKCWIEHIEKQERGWRYYLKNKEYLPLYYGDIINDPERCVKSSLDFLQKKYSDEDIIIESVFKKIATNKNEQFYESFLSNKSNLEFLDKLNINADLLTDETSELGSLDKMVFKPNNEIILLKKTKPNFNKYIKKINESDSELFKLFKEKISEEKLIRLNELSMKTYFVAMTPRSGSSYFMDLLKNTNKIGDPGEYLNTAFVPDISTALGANNISDYWINLINRKSSNNIFGIKLSFFHFLPLIETELDHFFFKKSKIILLKRKNIVKQAISLFLATQSDVFHTNIDHSKDKWKTLNNLAYDPKLIKHCLEHIHQQELGWDKYLKNKEFMPLYYEDIVKDPKNCVENVLDFLNQEYVDTDIGMNSIFKKISNEKNNHFYDNFVNEKSNIEYLHSLKLSKERF